METLRTRLELKLWWKSLRTFPVRVYSGGRQFESSWLSREIHPVHVSRSPIGPPAMNPGSSLEQKVCLSFLRRKSENSLALPSSTSNQQQQRTTQQRIFHPVPRNKPNLHHHLPSIRPSLLPWSVESIDMY